MASKNRQKDLAKELEADFRRWDCCRSDTKAEKNDHPCCGIDSGNDWI